MNNGAVHNLSLLSSHGPTHTENNFAPNEYREVVEDTKVIEPVGLAEIQYGVNGARNLLQARELTWTCTQQQITLLQTSTEGLSIPPALLFTKDQRKR